MQIHSVGTTFKEEKQQLHITYLIYNLLDPFNLQMSPK